MTEKQYFPHEIGARNNPKLQALEMSMGKAGKGLWWDVVDYMYECDGTLPADYRLLSYVLHCDAEDLRRVVEDFDLFVIADGIITKAGVQERIDRRNAAAEQKREAGRASGRARARASADEGTPVPQESNNRSNAVPTPVRTPFGTNQINQIKEKEINQGAGAGAPTREEDDFLIYEFFFRNMRKPGQEVARCLENYKDQGVRDWKAVASKWAPADTAPRFDDPRALQWAKLLYTYVGTAADKAEACECLRHIDDIKVDRGRNELTVRMRGGDWKDAVRDTIAQNAGLYMDFEAINVCKCANT